MPKRVPESELEIVVRLVEKHPGGVAIGKLLEEKELDLPKRTLQRRINLLLDEERLIARGEGRGRRYFVPGMQAAVEQQDAAPSRGAAPSWLSPEAVEIRNSVTKTLSERQPVGYQAGFLDSYVPNSSAYLSDDVRAGLGQLGQVGDTGLPAGTYLRKVLDRLLIDLSWNSSRLEGNTYSLLETQRLIVLGESAEGKVAQETQMILNHKAAIEMLADQAHEIGFNRYTICNLHALLSNNLLADPGAGGRLRSIPVSIGGTVYHPLEVPQSIASRFDRILHLASLIRDAFEQAFFVMVHLPYLQPFEDVNKRVSRLAANIPLIKHNLCPLSFVDVPQDEYVGALIGVYELRRIEYLQDVFVWAYRRSCARYAAIRQSLSDPDPFRLRYREQIGALVQQVVKAKMDKRSAATWIADQAAKEIPAGDRARFVEVVETELISLHAGNMARYRLRPSEYEAWESVWN